MKEAYIKKIHRTLVRSVHLGIGQLLNLLDVYYEKLR